MARQATTTADQALTGMSAATATDRAAVLKALARIAVGAGLEPADVRAAFGAHARCDTTAARRTPIGKLFDAANATIVQVGVDPLLTVPQELTGTATRDLDSATLRELQRSIMQCGSAFSRMSVLREQALHDRSLGSNRELLQQFDELNHSIDSLQREIAHRVDYINALIAQMHKAPNHQLRTTIRRHQRELARSLDLHDDSVHIITRTAHEVRWQHLGARGTRNQWIRSVKGTASDLLATTTRIRSWADASTIVPFR